MISDVITTENLALVAAVGSLAAFWVSWREVRRNNKVIVKLRSFGSHYREDRNGRTAYELEVTIMNRGIQMQNISMALLFFGPGRSGDCQLPIPLSDQSKGIASFLRGTTAQFVLSTADRDVPLALAILRDFKEQRPVIGFFHGSFLACSFRIFSRWDWFKALWNRVSFRFRFERRMGEGHHGKGVFKSYQLPFFVIRSEKLRFFVEGAVKSRRKNDLPGGGS